MGMYHQADGTRDFVGMENIKGEINAQAQSFDNTSYPCDQFTDTGSLGLRRSYSVKEIIEKRRSISISMIAKFMELETTFSF